MGKLLAECRQLGNPKQLNRFLDGSGVLAKGGKTLEQRAAKRVEAILAEHKPKPLPKDITEAVHAVVERAEAEYA